MKILMVCLGNICRSPLAEGILRHKIAQRKLGWSVDSAGTSNYHIDEPPHKLSQKVALEHGIDISDLRGRQFKQHDMQVFDIIYVMDADNYQDVKRISKELWNPDKTELIMNELYPHENRAVPDPWYGTEEGYHAVYKMLDHACDKILERFENLKMS